MKRIRTDALPVPRELPEALVTSKQDQRNGYCRYRSVYKCTGLASCHLYTFQTYKYTFQRKLTALSVLLDLLSYLGTVKLLY